MKLPTNVYQFIKSITVEPAVFFFHLANIIIGITSTNLYLQKACRHNITTEPNLDIPCDDEKAGILFVSSINANYRYIEMTIILILVILLMCWSDEAGKKRKILIIVPILGIIVQSLSGCLQSYFWYWPPLLAVLIDICIQVLSGGSFIGFAISTKTYICDISNEKNRTMRIGILMAVVLITMPTGNGVAGLLIRSIGFFHTYLLCLLLAVISLVSAILLVQDISIPIEKNVSIWSFLKCTRIVDSFKVIFKKSLGRRRIIVVILLIVHVASFFSTEGEKTIFYLFLRYKFKWDERMFSIYLCYKLVGVVIGTMFCSIILSKIFKIHDGIIGTSAGFWDTLAAVGYIFASQNWHLYAIPLLDIFHGTAMLICFSFATKFYKSNEFGRLNAVFSTFSLLVPFCHPVYNIVFQKTLDFFPSAFFVISVAINIAVCFLYGLAYVLTKKIAAQELTQTNHEASSPERCPKPNDTVEEVKTNVSTEI